MIQLGVALATGLPFMGMQVCGPCGVGLVLLEDDVNLIQGRLLAQVARYGKAFTKKHERKLDSNLRIMMERPFTDEELKDPALLDMQLAGLTTEICEKMKDTKDPPGLLVIDTLNAVHNGNESDAQETRPLLAALRRLHLALGASVYVTHHYRKMGMGKDALALCNRLDPELVRGSSAIVAGARAVFQFATVTKDDADKAGIMDWEDPHQYAVVALTKNNGGPKSKWMLWKHAEGGILVPVEDDEHLLAAMLGTGATKKLAQQDKLLLEIYKLRGQPMENSKVALALSISEDALRSLLSRLRVTKLITKNNALTPMGMTKAKELAGSDRSTAQY
jgi:hypothetical protein